MDFIFDSSSLKIPVDINENGFIAMSGDTATGSKNISIAGFVATLPSSEVGKDYDLPSYANAQAVINPILGTVFGTTYITSKVSQTITRKIGEV